MLNTAASALVNTEPDGEVKKERLGQGLASEYGNMEGKTESLKEQLDSLTVYINRDALPENEKIKVSNRIRTEEEIRLSHADGNVTERKLSNPGTERNKRVLPMTPKSMYSTPSQSVKSSQSKSFSVDSNLKRSSTSSSSVSSASSNASLSSETEEPEDQFLKTKPKQTHIALYKFVARHDDEISLDTGDAVHVDKKCEDLWYEGINLRTGIAGIFPSRYVSDILQESSVQGKHTVFFFSNHSFEIQVMNNLK